MEGELNVMAGLRFRTVATFSAIRFVQVTGKFGLPAELNGV